MEKKTFLAVGRLLTFFIFVRYITVILGLHYAVFPYSGVVNRENWSEKGLKRKRQVFLN